jgi:hypothetical protein
MLLINYLLRLHVAVLEFQRTSSAVPLPVPFGSASALAWSESLSELSPSRKTCSADGDSVEVLGETGPTGAEQARVERGGMFVGEVGDGSVDARTGAGCWTVERLAT